ncbi:nitrilase [Capronia coronata CBS 617.96]|uniref:Nitrilase n=1 Tax=Capronia coronata CBS 617.96 TaxID=1182541 RepID=W9XTU9_9EURO|nr:nitrilase [Capronia coronata CBS 617.96]EXJ83663.1 nitrilase [Capronia coronata CBS 617.96]
MPQQLTIGLSQSHTLSTLDATLSALRETTRLAAQKGISILLFPEAYLGGYPRTCSFGAAVGSRTDTGRDQFLAYYKSAVDLGDTPLGADDDWLDRKLPVNKETGRRGDGTREFLEDVARETGVFIVTGLVEKAGASLYCAAVYVDPTRGVLGKRRKVMPTGSERLVWAQGQASTLKAVAVNIKGVRVVMGCAICWENYMPLLRYSLYSQGVNLWLAPTADARDTWESLMKTVACEGRCFVLSANQCIKRKNLPAWITGKDAPVEDGNPPAAEACAASARSLPNGTHGGSLGGRRLSMSTRTEENHEIAWKCKDNPIKESEDASKHSSFATSEDEQFVSVGGSCIVNPMGKTVGGPCWEKEQELLYVEVDFDDCDRGHLDFDAAGHYSRPDAFKLTVEGLDLLPPP